MKLHSEERPNSIEPQLPLQAGSTPESSEKRNKKRRHKSKKTPLIEKKINAAHQAVETIIRQNEVRLIWDRDAPADEKVNSPAKKTHKEVAKKIVESAAVEAIIDHAKTSEPKVKKLAEKPDDSESVTPKLERPKAPKVEQAAEPELASENIESTPEAFSQLLDNLTAERQRPDLTVENTASRTPTSENIAKPFAPESEIPFTPPPTLPPEAKSYRHFFWNEPSIMSPAEAQAERSMLPSIEQQTSHTPAEFSNRTYVESQSSPAAKPEKPRPEKQPETPVQSAETIDSQPFLEAVPLHDMNELQFPERMPGSEKPVIETVPAYDTPPSVEALPAAADLQPQQELGLAELVKLSKKIKIDGVKLHEIFAAKRIDEAGLRAVIQEFLRGGNVRKQLTDEIVNKEKSFERDPSTRHLTSDQIRDKLANTSVKVVQKGYALGKTSKHVTREVAHVLKDAAVQTHHGLQESGIDVHWPSIAAIAIIYTLIIILLIA